MSYKVIVGDATKHPDLGKKTIIIPHVVNDIGVAGAGFVMALEKAFGKFSNSVYKLWYQGSAEIDMCKMTGTFALGEVQFVNMNQWVKKLIIANMVGQRSIGMGKDGRPPVRYAALVDCMRHVQKLALKHDATIVAPQFASDLAGGDWNTVELLIKELWVDLGIPVVVYDFPKPVFHRNIDRLGSDDILDADIDKLLGEEHE